MWCLYNLCILLDESTSAQTRYKDVGSRMKNENSERIYMESFDGERNVKMYMWNGQEIASTQKQLKQNTG